MYVRRQSQDRKAIDVTANTTIGDLIQEYDGKDLSGHSSISFDGKKRNEKELLSDAGIGPETFLEIKDDTEVQLEFKKKGNNAVKYVTVPLNQNIAPLLFEQLSSPYLAYLCGQTPQDRVYSTVVDVLQPNANIALVPLNHLERYSPWPQTSGNILEYEAIEESGIYQPLHGDVSMFVLSDLRDSFYWVAHVPKAFGF